MSILKKLCYSDRIIQPFCFYWLTSLCMMQYLSCLTTSRSLTDKLAFDVGLREESTGVLFLVDCYHKCTCKYTKEKSDWKMSLSSRWGMLVDHSPCIQAEVRGWEGQGGRRSHPCQRVFWKISGNDCLYCMWSTQSCLEGAYSFYLKNLSHQQHLSYASGDLMVDASFMQTLWNMNPVCSGCELAEGKQLILIFIVEITIYLMSLQLT